MNNNNDILKNFNILDNIMDKISSGLIIIALILSLGIGKGLSMSFAYILFVNPILNNFVIWKTIKGVLLSVLILYLVFSMILLPFGLEIGNILYYGILIISAIGMYNFFKTKKDIEKMNSYDYNDEDNN